MITNRNPRSYEVSIWTLQDSFITVLKQTNLEHKGLIEEAKMSLKDDSEDTFSFRIPMYIHRNGQRIENPLWYNTTNGNLIANLRKLKVIFNKGKQDKQRIFEFLITKVTESHQGFETYCEVESEGLAFNELGKTGYKIDLSEDLYLMEYNEWADAFTDKKGYLEKYNIPYDNNKITEAYEAAEPLNNINYWVDKVIPNDGSLGWTVEYNMNWSDFIVGNDNIEGLNSTKIYEEAYNENWEVDNNLIVPAANSLIGTKEKLRMVTANDSNRYNLTQTIAETFGVYCRYIYEHDDNFYITGRKIQFYNSGLKDKPEDIIDFNYYYDTEDISREMDSADQITKMIVLSNNSDADLIDSSITGVSANKSLEDYLLNFDYLYNVGAITKEQYEEVPKFEAKMRQHNEKLIAYSNEMQICEEKLIEARAEYENMRVMCAEDNERLQEEQNYIKHLLNAEKTDYDGDPATFTMTGYNPDICIVYTENNERKCNFKWESVICNEDHPIIIFKSLEAANAYGKISDLNELDTTNYIKIDSSNSEGIQLIKDEQTQLIIGIKDIPSDINSALFAVYSYSPDTYHMILEKIWKKKYKEDSDKLPELKAIVDNLHGERQLADDFESDYKDPNKKGLLYDLQTLYDTELEAKNQDILRFEKMMGPALREGTWQPEDTYAKYGDKKSLSNLDLNSNNSSEIFWDNVLFDGEDKNYYEEGTNLNKVYYPCIDLSGLMNLFTLTNLKGIHRKGEEDHIELIDLGFVWDDVTVPGMKNYIEKYNKTLPNEQKLDAINFPYILNIGSNAQLAFLKYIKSDNGNENESESAGTNEEKKYNKGDIIPVLMLTGAEDYIVPKTGETLTDALIKLNGSIGYITNNIINEKIESDEGQDQSETIAKNIRTYTKITTETLTWITNNELPNFEIVYPRIKISSYNFKNNTDNYSLYVNGTNPSLLSPYFSYNILNRYDYEEGAIDWANMTTNNLDSIGTDFSYYITIKPEVLFNYYNNDYPLFTFNYELSNTGLAIYLDALKIMKENAWPKVTYNITPKIIKTNFMETAYDNIHTLVHINDHDLKFENVIGYISGIDLDLDKPWEDSIEIKNYKTKFEDLFTSIVASTAQIQKNSTVINALSSVVTSNGQIAVESLQSSILGNNLQLAFTQGNNGTFTIEDKRILAESSSGGAVVYTASGIFTATEKDDDGNYIWNTGILPSGISANAITSGRIDTNLINIYSDNNLRLQLNKDGLFAYKSWFSDGGDLPQDKLEEINKREGMDPSQYVVHNSEGLFLIAKEGATPEYQAIKYATTADNNNQPLIITVNSKNYELDRWPIIKPDGTFDFTNERYSALTQDVNRVEISWNGLKLRNWNNDVTFYADPNTGDLVLGGTLIENSTYLTIPEEIMEQLYTKQNPEVEGAGENDNLVTDNNEPWTFEDYVIDAIKKNKDIRYLRSDIAAIKANDYIGWKATSISEQVLYDALGTEGRITSRLNDVSNTLNTFINDSYTPIIASITDLVNADLTVVTKVDSLPLNPQKYDSIQFNQETSIGDKIYHINTIYWYDGNKWNELDTTGISLGTNQELNLFGANATFAAGSELKMLAGGKLHLFGGEIYISSTGIANNQTEQEKLAETPLNGIVMDNNGLAIYSTKNITLGTQTVIENQTRILGLELDGESGALTAITSAEDNKNGAINFYRVVIENEEKKLKEAITLDGNGINIHSNSSFRAIAANEVLIASAENVNNGVGDGTPDSAGSYIWMHDVNIGTAENPSYQKQLDIGTTGIIAVNVDSLIIKTSVDGLEEENYTIDEYIEDSPTNQKINTWFNFNEEGLTISNQEDGTSLWKTVTGVDGYSVKYNDEVKFSVRQDKCQTNSIKIGDLVIKKSAKNGMVWVKE